MRPTNIITSQEQVVGPDGRPSLALVAKWNRMATEGVINFVGGVVTADYKVQPGDSIIPVDASAGDVDVTLPSPPAGEYKIKKIDSSPYSVTVSGADTIDGETSWVLDHQYDCLSVAGGQEWHVI